MVKNTVTIYLEGGGDTGELKSRCRKAFSAFFQKLGLKGRMPKLVACGSRRDAYERFETAIDKNDNAILLVDSEAAIKTIYDLPNNPQPWQHLKDREGDAWEKPDKATNEHCHFMTQCMENWFLADLDTLKKYFNQGFKENQLPSTHTGVEKVNKKILYPALKNATKSTTKGEYSKGSHSFALLEQLDAKKVIGQSPWALRLKQELDKRC